MNHTPGRWFADRLYVLSNHERIYALSDYEIVEKNSTIVCRALNDADASLIAAAPNMLSALEMVIAKTKLAYDVHDAVTRAIIKAKGGVE